MVKVVDVVADYRNRAADVRRAVAVAVGTVYVAGDWYAGARVVGVTVGGGLRGGDFGADGGYLGDGRVVISSPS